MIFLETLKSLLHAFDQKRWLKSILKRLLRYCGKNDIIPVIQAGFRKGRCTTDHYVKLTSRIEKNLNKSTSATFFDVAKAYDNVWHARLLYNLENVGITGTMLLI